MACVDKPAPAPNGAAGRTCGCKSGYDLINGVCKDIDACVANRCPDTATCTDLPGAPNDPTGRLCSCKGDTSGTSCTCDTGFEPDEHFLCKEIDACAE